MDDTTRAKFEISELISDYGNRLDAGDFDGLEQLFVEDAVFTVVPGDGVPRLTGAHSIRDTIEQRWRVVHEGAQRRHVMTNIVVESIAEDVATARTVLLVYEVRKEPGARVGVHGMGVYEDTLVRVDGRWRFEQRRLTLDRLDYFAPGWTSTE